MSSDSEERSVAMGIEPYLGLPTLKSFDDMIVVLMDQNDRIAQWVRANSVSDLQYAAVQLIPQTSSLILGTRELIRQGYLVGAAVMLRPILERVSTLAWLVKHPDDVLLWAEGWRHGTRPNLFKRMKSMTGREDYPEERIRDVLSHWNGVVHGDPASAAYSIVEQHGNQIGFSPASDHSSPERAAGLASDAAMYTVALVGHAAACFPDVGRQ